MKYTVRLTPEDLRFADTVGRQRFSRSRQTGTLDRANMVNPDRVGTRGEVAFGRLIGQPRKAGANGPDRGIDYISGGLKIDVKSVARPTSRYLILTNQGPWRDGDISDIHSETDIWVMMRPVDESLETWVAVGWCNRTDALNAKNIFLTPKASQPLGIHVADLRPMDQLLKPAQPLHTQEQLATL